MWISEDFCTWMVLCDKRRHVTEWRLINFFYTNSICHHRSGNLGQTKYRMSRETWDSWQPQLKTTLNAHWVMSLLNTAHVTRKAISSKIEQIYNNKWTNTLTCLHYAWNIKKNTHTHSHLTALFPGLARWAGTRKVKPIWILLKQETVSGNGISWAICKSAPCSRQTTTPAPHHSVFTGRMPFLPPNQQCQSTEGILKHIKTHTGTKTACIIKTAWSYTLCQKRIIKSTKK